MKKTLKLFLIILLLSVVVFTIAGCTKNNNKNEVTKTDNKNNEEVVEFTKGEWKDHTYENKFLGLKFNAPSAWEISTDEEIATMMGIGEEYIKDEKVNKEYLDQYMEKAVLYGMMATDTSAGDNVIIQFQKTPISGITEKALADEMNSQLEDVTLIDYEIGETKTEKLAGADYTTTIAKAEMSGIKLIQKYYIKVQGNYVSYIIITATSDSNLQDIINSFSKI